MPMTVQEPNHYKYTLATGGIDFESDTFKMVLLAPAFSAFDVDTHATYSDLTNEIADGNGYTTGGVTLTLDAVTENDTTDKLEVTWNNQTITASGGDIPDFKFVVVYDDTSTDNTIIFCVDLDTTISLTDGLSFIANNIKHEIV